MRTRRVIYLVAFIAAAVLLINPPISKKTFLNFWLQVSPSLDQKEIEFLNQWLQENVEDVGLVRSFSLNKITEDDIAFVIVEDNIPFVIKSISWNAVYSRDLNTIFIGKPLLDFIFSEDRPYSHHYVLLFILLHELGHYQLGHASNAMFDFESTPENNNLQVLQEEIDADAYSLSQFKAIYPKDSVTNAFNEDDFINTINESVLDVFMGEFLGTSNFRLGKVSQTHPELLSRFLNLVNVMASDTTLSEQNRTTQQVYSDWIAKTLLDFSDNLMGEVKAPTGLRFSGGLSMNDQLLFLMDNGQIAIMDLTTVTENDNLIKPKLVGEPLDVSKLQIRSGSFMWVLNNMVYLLLPYGKLYVTNEQNDWKWILKGTVHEFSESPIHKVETLNGHVYISIVPGPMETHIFEFIRYDDTLQMHTVFTFDSTRINDCGCWYKYVGMNRGQFLFEERDTSETYSEITGIGVVRERQSDYLLSRKANESTSTNHFPNKISPAFGQVFGVKRSEEQHIILSLFNEDHFQPIDTIFTVLSSLNPNTRLNFIGSMDYGLIDEFYSLDNQRQLYISVNGLGVFLYDYDTGELILNGGIMRNQNFSFQVENQPILVNSLYGGERVYLWKTKLPNL